MSIVERVASNDPIEGARRWVPRAPPSASCKRKNYSLAFSLCLRCSIEIAGRPPGSNAVRSGHRQKRLRVGGCFGALQPRENESYLREQRGRRKTPAAPATTGVRYITLGFEPGHGLDQVLFLGDRTLGRVRGEVGMVNSVISLPLRARTVPIWRRRSCSPS